MTTARNAMGTYTYTVGPNPRRASGPDFRGGSLHQGITFGRTVYANRPTDRPDEDGEVYLYGDAQSEAVLGYVSVDCLLDPSVAPVKVPEFAITIRTYEAAALALGVNGDLTLWDIVAAGGAQAVVDLLALAVIIQKEVDA